MYSFLDYCINQDQIRDISTLTGSSLKLMDKFTYLGSSVSSTENDINAWLAKAWWPVDRLSVMWQSDLSDRIKCNFFQAIVMSILLYGCTIWTLSKHMENKLDGNCTRMLWAILNKSWKQHPTKQQLYLAPISKTIQIRWTRHAGNSWRSKGKLIGDILQGTPSHRWAGVACLARTSLQQPCQMQWTIETNREGESGKSMLMAWHDGDDDVYWYLNFFLVWILEWKIGCIECRWVIPSKKISISFLVHL